MVFPALSNIWGSGWTLTKFYINKTYITYDIEILKNKLLLLLTLQLLLLLVEVLVAVVVTIFNVVVVHTVKIVLILVAFVVIQL